ncbi:hypothetical protein FT663_01963 [Candidozyma haemuli var. vulneris]|uniref:Uncharacterized protein n=1 Tax=Candidozyma haemuli TaxID=45357 RepID=A0A2V1AT99_9ASCO|nr:hypothetical protein CXQ85_000023 [[Candida] haemuloni]KAF3988616.1 hypothetical protein FT662_03295 [[Candida] haemuloni var. vulneris]KAF3993215.1 hypothetical protein FT663_01963 [[Candida] haemuloni var. vulneris]PVH21058.1 hypothetical protein CXQ85_000023 [[Candida] haemuloni]
MSELDKSAISIDQAYQDGLSEVQPKLIGTENFSLWKNNLFMEIHYQYPYVWKLINDGDEAVKSQVEDFEKVKKEANEVLDARVKSGIDDSLKDQEPFKSTTITTDNFSKEIDDRFSDATPENRAKALIYWFSAMTGKTRKVESPAQDMMSKFVLLVDDFEELLLEVYFHYEIPFDDFVKMLTEGSKLHAKQKDASYISQEMVIEFEKTHTLKKRSTPIKAARWVAPSTAYGNPGDPINYMSHSRILFEENAVDNLGDYEPKPDRKYRLNFNDEGVEK